MNPGGFKLCLFLIQTVVLTDKALGQTDNKDECPSDLRKVCQKEESCSECLLAHTCCNWCYDQRIADKFLCDFIDELKECGTSIERNRNNSVNIVKNQNFVDINDVEDASSAIQIKPQQFDVTLRKGQPLNISFTYKAAKNYPLELYYLGDLSYSMLPHLDTLKNLGNDLGRSLEELTKHYKLAFGSFLDKPGMPLIMTAPSKINNPCEQTEEGSPVCQTKAWLFKHSLNFTDKMSDFFEVVGNSIVSANLDDLDGALEAIFQILVCGKQFGWSESSRKIILLSTDSLLHTAGDGLLVGATEVNDELRCLMDEHGDHTEPLKYDYPSLPQIKMLLRKFKTNLIVAATKDKIKSYRQMERDILEEEAFVGVLKDNSENILELVKKGFLDFIRRVEFSANSPQIPELQLRFFVDCNGTNQYQQKAGCNNVEEEPVNFKLELSLHGTPSRSYEQIIIKESGINEEIVINIHYVGGSCKCENLPQIKWKCEHGTEDCGSCVCDLGWKGRECSEACREEVRVCRKDENSPICSSNGDCICGKCTCRKSFTGTYCEFECPMNKAQEICNNKGQCVEGECRCYDGYSNDDCSCPTAVDQCFLGADSEICSGNGTCTCNSCKCKPGHKGDYCEMNTNEAKNVVCEMYEEPVKNYFLNKTIIDDKSSVTLENNSVSFHKVENLTLCGDNPCLVVIFESESSRCIIQYCYYKDTNDIIHVPIRKNCDFTLKAIGYGFGIGIFVSIILAGLVIILFKKFQLWREEKIEFAKFNEQIENYKTQKAHEMNPIYVSPVVNYENPLHSSSTH
ncbi:integrin beta-nu-like [Euwallacea fornicatus]|uniref:integrin beta-nu-like n=1 Tax=Euwallacea fornicatus TaxID=995702 RepID=UPI00338DB254